MARDFVNGGIVDKIVITSSSDIHSTTAVTVMFWVYLRGLGSIDGSNMWHLYSDWEHIALRITNKSSLKGMFFTLWQSGGVTIGADNGGVALTMDQWYHVAGTYDGSTVKLRIYDAVAKTTTNYTNSATGNIVNSGNHLHIGNYQGGQTRFQADAKIAEVKYFKDVSLSDAEIDSERWIGYSVRKPNFYMSLHGNSSPEADLSGNGNNGTVTGTTKADHPPVGRYVAPPKYRPQIVISGGGITAILINDTFSGSDIIINDKDVIKSDIFSNVDNLVSDKETLITENLINIDALFAGRELIFTDLFIGSDSVLLNKDNVIADAISYSDVIVSIKNALISDGLNVAENLVNVKDIIMTETMISNDAIAKGADNLITDLFNGADVVIKTIIGATEHIINDVISFADTVVIGKNIILQDAISYVEKLIKGGVHVIIDVISYIENVIKVNINASIARPDSDISNVGMWTNSPLWNKIDEITPDSDTTKVTSKIDPVTADTFEVKLSAIVDPLKSSDHAIRYKAKGTFPLALLPAILKVQLYQNTILIAEETVFNILLNGVYKVFTYNLSESEANSITDYSNLRLRFIPNFIGSTAIIDITWAEFNTNAVTVVDINDTVGYSDSLITDKELLILDNVGFVDNLINIKNVIIIENINYIENIFKQGNKIIIDAFIRSEAVIKVVVGSIQNHIISDAMNFTDNLTFVIIAKFVGAKSRMLRTSNTVNILRKKYLAKGKRVITKARRF